MVFRLQLHLLKLDVTGDVLCRFESGITKGGIAVAHIRVLKALSPITPVDPSYDGYIPPPTVGDLLRDSVGEPAQVKTTGGQSALFCDACPTQATSARLLMSPDAKNPGPSLISIPQTWTPPTSRTFLERNTPKFTCWAGGGCNSRTSMAHPLCIRLIPRARTASCTRPTTRASGSAWRRMRIRLRSHRGGIYFGLTVGRGWYDRHGLRRCWFESLTHSWSRLARQCAGRAVDVTLRATFFMHNSLHSVS
jgi:hypothetical protein